MLLSLWVGVALAVGPTTDEPPIPPLIPTPVPWVPIVLALLAVYVVVRLANGWHPNKDGS